MKEVDIVFILRFAATGYNEMFYSFKYYYSGDAHQLAAGWYTSSKKFPRSTRPVYRRLYDLLWLLQYGAKVRAPQNVNDGVVSFSLHSTELGAEKEKKNTRCTRTKKNNFTHRSSWENVHRVRFSS